MVSDYPVNLAQIEEFFEDLNARITQQIQIDVRVVEVSLAAQQHLGVDWQALIKNLGKLNQVALSTNFASNNFSSGNVFTFSAQGPTENSGSIDKGVNAVIKALEEQGKVEVVSQPKITMLNNQLAVIQVGSTQSYLDSTRVETTQTGTVSTLSTAQVQQGVTMRLLGNVVGNDVYLSITPVVTTIDSIRSVKSGNMTLEAPQTTTKSINTLVKLTQGETVAIGGLITTQQSTTNEGVPGLSRVPVLGKLFSYQHKKDHKVELVIFITPRKI
jgi:MSHA type pilus biogenesis protein MshL